MSDKLAIKFAGFQGRCDAILDSRGYALECQDLEYEWYTAFVIGVTPEYAVAEALRARAPLPMDGTDYHHEGEV